LGLSEQTIFPEIEYDKIKKVFGMDIAIVTSAKKDSDAQALLEGLGMPFERKK
jgi:large subunit ribosomal protein L5